MVLMLMTNTSKAKLTLQVKGVRAAVPTKRVVTTTWSILQVGL